jgi:hypothetical protein
MRSFPYERKRHGREGLESHSFNIPKNDIFVIAGCGEIGRVMKPFHVIQSFRMPPIESLNLLEGL